MRLIHLAVVLPLIYLSNACSLLYEKEVEYEYLEPAVYPVLTAVGLAPIKALGNEGLDLSLRSWLPTRVSDLKKGRSYQGSPTVLTR